MPISDWNELCPQTIVWKPMLTRDQYGKPVTFGTTQTFRGRRTFKVERVGSEHPVRSLTRGGVKGAGAEVVATSQAWILGTPDVRYEDQVYVQGDDPNRVPPILNIQRVPDENGDLYVKVSFGSFTG